MRLIRYNQVDEHEYQDYIQEWNDINERITPSLADNNDLAFPDLLLRWKEFESKDIKERDLVPATLYFAIDQNSKVIGAIDFRHELNNYLLNFGGNIGYGIRPSMRRQGFATEMLKLMLSILKDFGYRKVLITCFVENIGSARVIESCGGLHENAVEENGYMKDRYWVNL